MYNYTTFYLVFFCKAGTNDESIYILSTNNKISNKYKYINRLIRSIAIK